MYQQAFVVGPLNTQKDMYNLLKHENKTEKLAQLGTELPDGDRRFPVGNPFRIQAPKLIK